MSWQKVTQKIIPLLVTAVVLTTSAVSLEDPMDQAHLFTANFEYDYIAWLTKAVEQKAAQAQLNPFQRLTTDQQAQLVKRYFDMTRELEIIQARVELVYIDPQVKDPAAEAAELLTQQHALEESLEDLSALVESILQAQVAQVLAEQGLGFLAQPQPPILYHSTPLPKALIVSPRNTIQQDVNISLLADLGMEEITALESRVEEYMDVSALVVNVGGIGVYPTMVQRSSSIEWTLDTIVHEWTHNYLTLHP